MEVMATADWTFLVYMDGDCDLERSAIDDFLEMSQAGSTSEVNIIIQFDRIAGYDDRYGDWTGCLNYRVEQGMTPTYGNARYDIGEVNMGDPQTLYDFLDMGIWNYPAHNYALVFWDHGMHWYGGCSDDSSGGDALNMSDIDLVLYNIYEDYDNFTFDIIDFDACLMASLEVAYQICDYGSYMIASEKTEPGAGLVYDASLTALVDDPGMSPLEFANRLLSDYEDYYEDTSGTDDWYLLNRSYTLSIINLSNIDNLVTATDDLAWELYTNMSKWFNYLNYTRNMTEAYDGPYHGDYKIIDLYHFTELLAEHTPDLSMGLLSLELTSALSDAIENETHGTNPLNPEVIVENATGLTIYYPEFADEFDIDYIADEFFYFPQYTWWPDMLYDAYSMPANTPPCIDSYLPAEDTIYIEEGDAAEFELDVSDDDDNFLFCAWLVDDVLMEGEYNRTFTLITEMGDTGTYNIAGTVLDGPMTEDAILRGFTGIDHVEWTLFVNESTKAGWTFMVYLDGDCDLEQFAISDMNEMEEIGSTEDVNIVVLVDRWDGTGADEAHPDDTSNGDWTDARIYYITKDNDTTEIRSDSVAELGEVNMGDPDTLIDFAEFVYDEYPAQRYALIFWDHGMGWPGVCPDDSEAADNPWGKDFLNMAELDGALDEITSNYRKKLDIIGFDACLMGMLEVDYEIADYGDLRVGSEEAEPGDGLLYKDFLDDLIATPDMNPEALAKLMTTSFVSSYTDGKPMPDDTADITQSAVDLGLVGPIVTALNGFSDLLISNIDTYNEEIMMARYRTQDFGGEFESVDLADFAKNVKESVDDAAITSAATALVNAVNLAVIEEGHGEERPASTGMAIYFPENNETCSQGEGAYTPDYGDISFAEDTSWDDFLLALYDEFGRNLPPEVEMLHPEEEHEVEAGGNVTFQALAVDPEDEGDLTYTWYKNNTKLVNGSGVTVTDEMLNITFSEDEADNQYIIKLSVADVWGYKSWATWYINVIPPTTLSGVVNDTNGVLLEEVTVSIKINPATWLNTTTDAAGEYVIENVPPAIEPYMVIFTLVHYMPSVATELIEEPGEVYVLNVTMTPITWGTITGVVTALDDTGVPAPVEGVIVSLSQGAGNDTTWVAPDQTTNILGVFTFINVTAGEYNLTISKGGYEVHIVLVSVEADFLMDLGNITLIEAFAVLQGTVTFDDGNPGGVNATVIIGETSFIDITSDELNIENIPPGTYNIIITAPGYSTVTRDNYTLRSGMNTLNITLSPINNTVTLGPFKDKDGKILANVVITIVIDGKTFTGTTDADGIVIIDIGTTVAEGKVIKVTATAEGMKPISFTVNGSAPGTVDIPYMEETSPEKGGVPTLVIIIVIIVVVLIVVVLIVIILIKKKKGKKGEGEKYDESGGHALPPEGSGSDASQAEGFGSDMDRFGQPQQPEFNQFGQPQQPPEYDQFGQPQQQPAYDQFGQPQQPPEYDQFGQPQQPIMNQFAQPQQQPDYDRFGQRQQPDMGQYPGQVPQQLQQPGSLPGAPMLVEKSCPTCGAPVEENWFLCNKCKNML